MTIPFRRAGERFAGRVEPARLRSAIGHTAAVATLVVPPLAVLGGDPIAVTGMIVIAPVGLLLARWARRRTGTLALLSATTAALWLLVPPARLGAWVTWTGLIWVASASSARGSVLAPLLLSPVLAIPVHAGVEYARGEAVLHGFGLPAVPGRLDPVCRARHLSGGCVVEPLGAYLIDPIHNATVCGLTRLFGPMPGAYSGPYPTAEQAFARLESAGRRIDPSTFWYESLSQAESQDSALVRLRRSSRDRIRADLETEVDSGPWTTALFGEELLLVSSPGSERAPRRLVVLWLETGEYLTVYREER